MQDPPADPEPVDPWHCHVEHHDVRCEALDRGKGRATVGRGPNLVPLRAERALEHPANRGVVVDDENRCIRHDSSVRVVLGLGGPYSGP